MSRICLLILDLVSSFYIWIYFQWVQDVSRKDIWKCIAFYISFWCKVVKNAAHDQNKICGILLLLLIALVDRWWHEDLNTCWHTIKHCTGMRRALKKRLLAFLAILDFNNHQFINSPFRTEQPGKLSKELTEVLYRRSPSFLLGNYNPIYLHFTWHSNLQLGCHKKSSGFQFIDETWDMASVTGTTKHRCTLLRPFSLLRQITRERVIKASFQQGMY